MGSNASSPRDDDTLAAPSCLFVAGRRRLARAGDRKNAAACVVSLDARVGCDLEAIEPRTSRFVDDFFTEYERKAVQRTSGELRDRHVALTWSAKESALKVLRVGLRRDTRSVEVAIGDSETRETGWHVLDATVRPEHRRLRGWWRADDDVVLTVVCDSYGAQMGVRLKTSIG